MMRIGTVFLLCILFGCQQHSRYEIVGSSGLNNSEELIEYLSSMIDDDRSNELILLKRANAYYDREEYRLALKDVKEALLLAPTSPDLHLFLAKVYDAMNNHQASIASALEAEQRGLKNYELYRILALNYLELDQIDNAKKAIERLTAFQKSANNLSLKGDIYLQLTDTLEAVESYESAISIDEIAVRPYYSLYEVYRDKDPVRAEKYVNDYLEVGDNRNMIKLKAQLLAEAGLYDSALTVYKSIDAHISSDLGELIEVGKVYFQKAQYDSALSLSSASLGADSSFRDAALLTARSLDKLRKYNDARNLYTDMLERDSTDVLVREELDILNRKIAYLWRLRQQEQAMDSIRNSAPPVLNRKEVDN